MNKIDLDGRSAVVTAPSSAARSASGKLAPPSRAVSTLRKPAAS